MKGNALEKIRKSTSLRQSRRFHAGSRTRTFLTGSVLCNPSQDMRVCQAWTELRQSNEILCRVHQSESPCNHQVRPPRCTYLLPAHNIFQFLLGHVSVRTTEKYYVQ